MCSMCLFYLIHVSVLYVSVFISWIYLYIVQNLNDDDDDDDEINDYSILLFYSIIIIIIIITKVHQQN